MAYEYVTTRLVQFAETDMAGIIHFANYFRYMEEAEHAFLRSLGLSVMNELPDGYITWPRVSASCAFLAPVRFEDEVLIHLRVARKGKSSMRFEFLFSKDGAPVARGEIVTACCQFKHGQLQSIPIPDWIGEKIEQAPGNSGSGG